MNGAVPSGLSSWCDDEIFRGATTIPRDKDNETLAQDALHWLIASRDEPGDAALQERLRIWRATSPAHERAWQEAERTWDALGDLPAASESKPQQRKGGRQSASATMRAASRPRGRRVTATAIGLIAACLCIAYLPVVMIWFSADHRTGTAETRQIRLEDGSTVYLGADSAIKLAYAPERRRIHLLSGQAYFDVAPDRNRPMTVVSGDVETTVLGTAFDVRMQSSSVAVAVNHGRVAVARADDARDAGPVLRAGDWARVADGTAIERGTGAADAAGSWRSGTLIVTDETVADMIDEIRRYYRGKIVVLNAGLGHERVTGVFKLNDPLAALRAVAEANGGAVRQISPWLTVVYRN
ncbi:FecR family protein [Tardiphaga alba]|uniref:FecR family protein n=1 Tax=Tardiphaga alba TaxID=340268 RepID=A0ABX8A874_9BRAD|nr:FecR family protein [Tardiphaga alba]QUS39442.1 FecR family protein [Tardiphaga alba]